MVMENILFGRNGVPLYDLKGTQLSRYTPNADGGKVRLDGNYVKDINISPLLTTMNSKQHFEQAILSDTHFLASINVMDYSLLLGVDDQKDELVCGIIDYLRQYTWDKKLESCVKSFFCVPKNVMPTVVSPENYKRRFDEFMSMHMMCLPGP
ncbi:hypothetical protein MKW92_006256 [Papaver armeniacum]|nr:hypothetical protein MKW92_006256 [Papaver armeniacum]